MSTAAWMTDSHYGGAELSWGPWAASSFSYIFGKSCTRPSENMWAKPPGWVGREERQTESQIKSYILPEFLTEVCVIHTLRFPDVSEFINHFLMTCECRQKLAVALPRATPVSCPTFSFGAVPRQESSQEAVKLCLCSLSSSEQESLIWSKSLSCPTAQNVFQWCTALAPQGFSSPLNLETHSPCSIGCVR